MSKSNCSDQQSICGDPRCPGSSCQGCRAFRESEEIHAKIECPHKASYCCEGNLCDDCQAMKNSLVEMRERSVGGGKAHDVDSRQEFSSDSLAKPVICELCKKSCGSDERCEWCIDFLKSFETGGGDVSSSMPRPKQTSKFVARGGSGGGSACEASSMPRPQKTHNPVGEGRAEDVPSITEQLKCLGPPTCNPNAGGLCDNCMVGHFAVLEEEHKRNSPENPNPPQNVNTDSSGVYGPRDINELGACTTAEIDALRKELWCLFLLFIQERWNFSKKFPQTTSNVLEKLAESNVPVGFEGHNNSCFAIMGFFLFCFDKQIRDHIDTSKFAGFILRYITQEFRSRLFVDRKLIQLFREEAAKVMNGRDDDDFTHRISCPNDYLARLEASGIVRKGPRVSNHEIAQSQASFVTNEIYRPSSRTSGDGMRCDSLREAFSLVISPDIKSGSTVCFQFKENICVEFNDTNEKTANARPSGAGNMMFPKQGVTVGGIILSLVFFTIIDRSHYRAIFYLDGKFFHFNSLSASNEGHHLPVLTVLSTHEAIELWKTNAHTAVFKCERSSEGQSQEAPAEVSSALPQPQPLYLESGLDILPDILPDFLPDFIQDRLVPPPPLLPDCGAQVAQAPQPPLLPACGAQVAHHVQKLNPDFMYMIYANSKWFLNTTGRNGIRIAEGEILGTGRKLQYNFGKSTFSSRNELEIALQAVYGKESRQDFS
jgi:hypothetical protein